MNYKLIGLIALLLCSLSVFAEKIPCSKTDCFSLENGEIIANYPIKSIQINGRAEFKDTITTQHDLRAENVFVQQNTVTDKLIATGIKSPSNSEFIPVKIITDFFIWISNYFK